MSKKIIFKNLQLNLKIAAPKRVTISDGVKNVITSIF